MRQSRRQGHRSLGHLRERQRTDGPRHGQRLDRRRTATLHPSQRLGAGAVRLLAALFVFTKLIQPDYGTAAFGILVLAALPYAFATAGQSIAIIAGGIDLSMAAMMTLLSVSAAALMQSQSEEFGTVAVALILLMGLGGGGRQRPLCRAYART